MPDQSPSPSPAFRVLVVVSRPLDLDELPTIADQWALLKGLATVKVPVCIQVVSPPTIQQFGLEYVGGYDVVHFDGHGALGVRCPNCTALNPPECHKCERCDASLEGETCRSYLVFEKDDGAQDAMAAEELVERICGIPDSPTKLVFLSACESAAGGDSGLTSALLNGGIPCILAMNEPVSVDVTKALSSAFYAALGAGMTIIEAFKFAVPALSRLPDRPETGTKAREIPVLLGEGAKERLVISSKHGSVTMNQKRLLGVPEYDFVGEYIRDNPPRGRKGLLLQIVQALLGGEKLVVLTGQGGIGKSVLASVAARRIAWKYPGGVFWRSAAETLGLNELLDAFANVLGYEFRTRSLDAKRDAVLGYLGDLETPSLIVVDNAEKVNDPALWSFLEGLPQSSAALVASREALTRDGLHINVPKMEFEESIGLFEEYDGYFENSKPGLFVSASRRATNDQRWGDRLSSKDMDILMEIDRLLDGHPLGIKLAAALVASNSLEAICEKLRDAPPKEVSDRFDFSYNTLTGSQKELLHRIAAFASSVEEWAIGAVAREGLFERDKAEQLRQWGDDLSELVRKSFVEVEDTRSLDDSENEVIAKRYRLHPLMRQYAAAKAGELEMQFHCSRSAHLFLEFAEMENYDDLESERANILAGADWTYNAEEWDLVRRFSAAIIKYLDIRGYWKDASLLLERTIDANEELGDKSSVAISLHELGKLAQKAGDMDNARSLFHQCLEIQRKLKDKSSISHTLWHLGNLALEIGDFDEGKKLLQERLKIEREIGDTGAVASSLVVLGDLALKTKDIDESRRLYKESLKVSKYIDDKRKKAIALLNLGMLADLIGNQVDAIRHLQKSLKISEDIKDKALSARTLKEIGVIAQANGDLLKARKFYNDSLDILQDAGDKMEIATLLYHLATLAQISGDIDEAKKLHQNNLKISKEIGNKKMMVLSMSELGDLAFNADNFSDARTYYLDSLEINQEIGDKCTSADLLCNLGIIAEELKDSNEAEQFYQAGMKISKEIGDGSKIVDFLHHLGVLAQDSGDYDKAKHLYQDGLKISQEIGDEESIEDFEYHLEILKRK